MNRPRHQFLSRAALAGHEYIALARGRVAHHTEGLADLWTVADDILKRIPRLDLRAKDDVLHLQPFLFQSPPDRDPDFIRSKRFGNVIVDPLFYRVNG